MRRKKEIERRRRTGFTLVELLVVIVILAMLSGLVAPKFFKQIDESKVKACRPKMAIIESAIEIYQTNTSEYPIVLEDLLVCPQGLESSWAGPYVEKKSLFDPWDNPFVYESYGSDYDLVSFGKDGIQGGEGYNADIANYDEY